MDRKSYMRDVYSKYWSVARETTYHFDAYDKNVCNYILENVPNGGKLLEVACGYGYPVADFLAKTGFKVSGIDISPALVEKCHRLNPGIDCKVGDAEEIAYPDNHFDCTYCFHSSWYFPNLMKAIDEMLRVTSPGGLVLFDIQNRSHAATDRGYRRRLFETGGVFGRCYSFLKNIAKILLRRGVPIWHPVVFSVPTYPESIYAHLKTLGITNVHVMIVKDDESMHHMTGLQSFPDHERLVFAIRK